VRRSRLACPQVLRATATEGRRHPRRCRCSPCAPSLLFSHTAVTAASFISGLLPGKRYELRVSKNRSLGALGESTTAGAVSPELERLGGKRGEIISPSCPQVSSGLLRTVQLPRGCLGDSVSRRLPVQTATTPGCWGVRPTYREARGSDERISDRARRHRPTVRRPRPPLVHPYTFQISSLLLIFQHS
jgi:hypothetical protein